MLGTTNEPLTNQRKDRFMAKADLTAQRLRELLDYDPETGRFTWRVKSGHRRAAGMLAGGKPAKNGYLRVGADGGVYFAHRLAWLYVHGEWPRGDIDHMNGNRTDNRIANLRDVSRSINLQNRRSSHMEGRLLGTCLTSGKWIAQIKINRKVYYIGAFATEAAAHEAYVAAKRKLHEGCTI